jgi:hypothetical protein
MVMDVNKYKNDGWGISVDGFEQIVKILNGIDFSKFDRYNILEFGSGTSTRFFVDYIEENNLKNVYITSFENDMRYSTNVKHPQLDLKLRKLITCDDSSYVEMFNLKQYNQYRFSDLTVEPTARQKNCFYDIKKNDIPDVVNFMLLDGPGGNGRNIAFLHTLGKLQKDSIVFIDDYSHYDFLEKFNLLYNAIEIIKVATYSDKFVILRVI